MNGYNNNTNGVAKIYNSFTVITMIQKNNVFVESHSSKQDYSFKCFLLRLFMYVELNEPVTLPMH